MHLITLLTYSLPVLLSVGRAFATERVGYYEAYNTNVQNAAQIPYQQYTNLIYFVAEPKQDFTLNLNGQSESDLKAFVYNCKKFKVVPSFSVGGWTGSRYFSSLVGSAQNRTRFISEIVKFSNKYGFQGVDIDWEYPTQPGIGCNQRSPKDIANFGFFLKQLRATVGKSYRITAALGQTGLVDTAGNTVNMADVASSLDYGHIMPYDTFGAWTPETGPNSPITSTCAPADAKGLSMEDSLAIFTRNGFPKNKLIFGAPAYSHGFKVTGRLRPFRAGGFTTYMYQKHSATSPPGDQYAGGAAGDICGVQQPAGDSWFFRSLVKYGLLSTDFKKGKGGFVRYWDSCNQQPFLYNNQTGLFIPYDDPTSFQAKAAFSKGAGVAGMFVFGTDGDTDNADLIKSLRSVLG